MKIVIINCFETYEERVLTVLNYFEKKGDSIEVITSNFMHMKKESIKDHYPKFRLIDVVPYKRNLSLTRLYSHYKFAQKALEACKEYKADLIYVLIPPNSLVKSFSKYKIENNKIKLIFDVIDLWPETMPISRFKNIFPFTIWKNIRDKYINYADYIITECDMFKKHLNINSGKIETVYYSRDSVDYKFSGTPSTNERVLGYLGSINNIIDIDAICDVVSKILVDKPVTVKIVGDGEKKDVLIKCLQELGAKTIFYGKIYDRKVKQDIFDSCHFGLNLYKDTTCIGVTMKSIDYFELGVPLINNIPVDTHELVKKYHAGYNLPLDTIEYRTEMREASRNIYLDHFTTELYCKKMDAIINQIM